MWVLLLTVYTPSSRTNTKQVSFEQNLKNQRIKELYSALVNTNKMDYIGCVTIGLHRTNQF
jgi:hypothetical protein